MSKWNDLETKLKRAIGPILKEYKINIPQKIYYYCNKCNQPVSVESGWLHIQNWGDDGIPHFEGRLQYALGELYAIRDNSELCPICKDE